MRPKISMITLGVWDLERSLQFYRDGLGFAPHNYKSGDDMVMFVLEGSWLGLYPRAALAEDAQVPDDGHGFRGVTLAHNVRDRHEVSEVLALAAASGGKIVKPAQDVFWGGHSGYFADPDGFLWEVAFNPFTDLS